MNNDTNTNKVEQPTVNPVAPVTPVANTVTPVVASQTPPVVLTPQTTPKKQLNIPKIDPKNIIPMIKAMPLKFKLMGGFVGLLVVLLILASFTTPGKKVVSKLILPSAAPIPTVTPIGDISQPTQYANDPDILTIKSKIADFNKKISDTSQNEDNLRPPTLDFDVNFKAQ